MEVVADHEWRRAIEEIAQAEQRRKAVIADEDRLRSQVAKYQKIEADAHAQFQAHADQLNALEAERQEIDQRHAELIKLIGPLKKSKDLGSKPIPKREKHMKSKDLVQKHEKLVKPKEPRDRPLKAKEPRDQSPKPKEPRDRSPTPKHKVGGGPCTVCETDTTSIWRRLDGQVACNACWARNRRDRGSKKAKQEPPEAKAEARVRGPCSLCQSDTTGSNTWRRLEGHDVCNKCWLRVRRQKKRQ